MERVRVAGHHLVVKNNTTNMEIKTITYQRVLNLGNYESKRLEMTAEMSPGDDLDFETGVLMEMVERKLREDASQKIEQEIRQLKQELRELQQQITTVKSPPAIDTDTLGGF